MTAQGALNHITTTVLSSDNAVLNIFFTYVGITDIDDFMSMSSEDFKDSYYTAEDSVLPHYLNTILVKRLVSLQLWFVSQPNHSLSDWYSLTADVFRTWTNEHNAQRIASTSSVPIPTNSPLTLSVPSSSFRLNVKINVADYNELKEDSQ